MAQDTRHEFFILSEERAAFDALCPGVERLFAQLDNFDDKLGIGAVFEDGKRHAFVFPAAAGLPERRARTLNTAALAFRRWYEGQTDE